MLTSVEFIALFIGMPIIFVEWKIGFAYLGLVLGLITSGYVWTLIPNTLFYDIYGVALFTFVLAVVYKIAVQEK